MCWSCYRLIIVWDYQSGKRRIHFRLYVNFRSHLFATFRMCIYIWISYVRVFLLCDYYIRIRIVNNGITKWLVRTFWTLCLSSKKYDRWDQSFECICIHDFSLQTRFLSLPHSVSTHQMGIPRIWGKKRKANERMVKGKNQSGMAGTINHQYMSNA